MGKTSTKFKVGDRVRHLTCVPDEVGTVTGADDKFFDVAWPDSCKSVERQNNADIVLVANDNTSPVRTVTRREIVPGVYGQVVVGKHATPGWIDIRWPAPGTTSSELRDAARIFNEIADVLDEQKEAA